MLRKQLTELGQQVLALVDAGHKTATTLREQTQINAALLEVLRAMRDGATYDEVCAKLADVIEPEGGDQDVDTDGSTGTSGG